MLHRVIKHTLFLAFFVVVSLIDVIMLCDFFSSLVSVWSMQNPWWENTTHHIKIKNKAKYKNKAISWRQIKKESGKICSSVICSAEQKELICYEASGNAFHFSEICATNLIPPWMHAASKLIQVRPVFGEFIDHVVCRFKKYFITQYTGRGDLWFMASSPSWLFLSFSESILYENKTKKTGNTWKDGINPRTICFVVAKTMHVLCAACKHFICAVSVMIAWSRRC